MFLLDTNILTGIYKNDNLILKNLAKKTDDQFSTCLFCVSEILYGINRLPSSKRKLDFELFYGRLFTDIIMLDFTFEAAVAFADIKLKSRNQGNIIEDSDLLIAATAIANEAILVTRNIEHFERISGLEVVEW